MKTAEFTGFLSFKNSIFILFLLLKYVEMFDRLTITEVFTTFKLKVLKYFTGLSHIPALVLLVPGFAPDGGQRAERDEGAGLCQRQFAVPLHSWGSGCPDPRG